MSVPFAVYRWGVTALTAFAVLMPLAMLGYQSLLDGSPAGLGAGAYRAIFADPQFRSAAEATLALAGGMTALALPLGAGLAFLLVRTDLPGRNWIEPLVFVPIAMPGIVLAFGYLLGLAAAGSALAQWKPLIAAVPRSTAWLVVLIVLSGLMHAAYVCVFTAGALRELRGDIEDCARVTGATGWTVALRVSLPMALPAILAAGILVFVLGVALFGLPLVLGEPKDVTVLSTHLYKLGTRPGGAPHQLMAAIAVTMVAVTIPLMLLQRWLHRRAPHAGAARGKERPPARFKLRGWRWPVFAAVLLWLAIAAFLPLAGVVLRSFMMVPGDGNALTAAGFTLDHYRALFDRPDALRGLLNTLALGIVGGAVAVLCYGAVALAYHSRRSPPGRALDYLAALPRAMPGIVAGLAILWLVLLVKPPAMLQASLAPIWFAYALIWLGLGVWLFRVPLARIAPELEEAARVAGADEARARCHVGLPLIRSGMVAGWFVLILVFVREYTAGIFLVGAGTELVGPMLVSLWSGGMVDRLAALATIDVAMLAAGLAVALGAGVRRHG